MAAEAGKSDIADSMNDIVIENIWHELGGRVTHEEIRQVAAEVMGMAEFQNATVTTFLPILIRRRTCEKLRTMVANATPPLAEG
jgi:hypothetical protein